MVLTRSQTRMLRGGPGSDDPAPSNLKEEVKRKVRLSMHIAHAGSMGMMGSGRKTLAYRFRHMDRGIFTDGEVPSWIWFKVKLYGHYPSGHRSYPSEYLLRLVIHIIPQAPSVNISPPFFWMFWNDFCCVASVFDVTNRVSFRWTTMALSSCRDGLDYLPDLNLPPYFLVGNKSDGRHEEEENLDNLHVFRSEAEGEAENNGIDYYEVSAKENRNVDTVLSVFRNYAIRNLGL